jgi:hypothetical protein
VLLCGQSLDGVDEGAYRLGVLLHRRRNGLDGGTQPCDLLGRLQTAVSVVGLDVGVASPTAKQRSTISDLASLHHLGNDSKSTTERASTSCTVLHEQIALAATNVAQVVPPTESSMCLRFHIDAAGDPSAVLCSRPIPAGRMA